MFTGYSQGGHSSMAAHRAAERDIAGEFNVVAGAHLAGPYNLSGSFKLTQAIAGYQFFVPYLVTSYQKVYGDVYTDVNTVFKAPYAGEHREPAAQPDAQHTTLVTTGALPGGNGETPTRRATRCSRAPSSPTCRPTRTTRSSWTPRRTTCSAGARAPSTLLCGGAGDPTVPPAVHMVPMKADFDARGVTTVTTVDVDAQIQATYGPGGQAPTDPTSRGLRHLLRLLPRHLRAALCHARARALFDTVR